MMNSLQQEPFVAMRREDSKYSPDLIWCPRGGPMPPISWDANRMGETRDRRAG